jgi:predicted dinucleotide-binding enzyme
MISFIGGTGPEGRGLALRFAIIGEQIFLGSRDPQRGIASAADVRALNPDWATRSVICRGRDTSGHWADIPRPAGEHIPPPRRK